MTITGKYVEKKNPQELLVGLKFVVALYRMIWRFLKKYKRELLCDPGISLLGIYLKKRKKKKANLKKYAHFNFFSAFFTIVRIRK